jgi:hypothetical protein
MIGRMAHINTSADFRFVREREEAVGEAARDEARVTASADSSWTPQ